MSILIYFHTWVGDAREQKHLIEFYHIAQLTIAIPAISQSIATSNPAFAIVCRTEPLRTFVCC